MLQREFQVSTSGHLLTAEYSTCKGGSPTLRNPCTRGIRATPPTSRLWAGPPKAKGLSGKAFKQLLASGNAGGLAAVDIRRDANLLEAALKARDRAAESLGAFAGNTVLNKQLATHTRGGGHAQRHCPT